MAYIENRSRFKITVHNRGDLTRTFPFDAQEAVKAYVDELKVQKFKPKASRLNDAYLVRFRTTGYALHTPKWVFAVFFLLLWLGTRQLVTNRASLNRITLIPIVMGALSVYGVVSVFGDSLIALGGWAAAAVAMLALVLQYPLPATTRYDAAHRRFHVSGSPVPLVLMMGIFLTKYVVGAALAMHPEVRQQAAFGLVVPVLYGAFSGVFVARAVRLWKLAIRTDTIAVGASAA